MFCETIFNQLIEADLFGPEIKVALLFKMKCLHIVSLKSIKGSFPCLCTQMFPLTTSVSPQESNTE